MRNKRYAIFFLFLLTFMLVFGVPQETEASILDSLRDALTGSVSVVLQALTRDELERGIQERNSQLETITKELQQTTQTLSTTRADRLNLQKQVNTIDASIKSLGLRVKAHQLNIQKLSLELDALRYDVQDVQQAIAIKRQGIGALLRAIEKQDRMTPLALILSGKNFSESIFEKHALGDLQLTLSNDMDGLRDLEARLSGKIGATTQKKIAISNEQRDLLNREQIIADQKQERQAVLAQTKLKESQVAARVTELQKLQQQIAAEVEKIDAALRAKINPSTLPSTQPGGLLAMPVDGGRSIITQDYGYTAFARSGYAGKRHNGVDFGVSVGTPILAAEAGSIVASGNQDAYCPRGAYGKFIIVKHTNNLTTLYAHLSRQIVAVGQTVARGEVIGYSGSTGYATGPHLHFTVYASPTFYMGPSMVCGPMPFGGDINPLQYLL